MSLIQDALKRQQEEMNKKTDAPATPATPHVKIPLRMMGQPTGAPRPPETPARPASPVPPLPLPPPIKTEPRIETTEPKPEIQPGVPDRNEPESEKRSPALLIIALMAVILLLAAGGLYWAWPLLLPKLPKPPPPAPVAAAIPPPSPIPPPAVTPPAVTPPVAVLNTVTAAAPAKVLTVDTNEVSTLQPEAVPGPTEQLALPVVRDEPPPSLFVPPPPKAEAAAPVLWPAIKLTGMVKLGGTAAALINGRVVAPGESIEDVTLISVKKEGALLRYKTEERLLRVGETAR